MDSISALIGVPKNAPLAEDSLKRAWENVVLKGLSPGRSIKPEVLSSWKICREICLDPFSEMPLVTLSKKRLIRLLKRNKDLIEVAKPVINMIEIIVKGTGFVISVAEKQGYVLMARGDEDVLEKAKRNHYQPGCLRKIGHAGTNAIGLCLKERKPIQLTGAEHYKVPYHSWTCSSAPIFDSKKRAIGVITLSGESIGQHKHTLALVTSAAETIQSQLREKDLIEEKQRLNSLFMSIFNSISDGIIAIDSNLTITNLNSAAAAMLGLDKETVIGKSLTEVVEPDYSLIQVLGTSKYSSGLETNFICPSGQKAYICRIDPIGNENGQGFGSIITLTQKKHMMNIAKRIGGNYAKYEFKDIKGSNPGLERQIELAKVAAKTNSRILIIGESGTGKELFAQAIHCHSSRRNGPFVAISCSAIPRDLVESELFGYRGGAFTGARRGGMVGKFEFAHKGTLFLDEINGLPLELQAKLLRVLQQNEIMRLGDTRCIPVDVRVIAASNIDLLSEVEKDNFREDLYYRLNVVEVLIPPLRERIDDLELLITHIMSRQCQEMGIGNPRISDEVLEIVSTYQWPGNIRELENCIERALLLSKGGTIRKVHLPDRIWKKPNGMGNGAMSLSRGFKEMIEAALDRCSGNVSVAARELKISRSTLYRKMNEFGLSK